MSAKDIYQRFLDLPNPISLSENASLHYITTLTTFAQPAQIVRHLESQAKKVVKTRSVKIISAVEGANALALEVETVLEFISGGGAYLPGLENFVVDKIATLPLTHIVYFDAQHKISQIRISWDQGSLLRQVDVIGSRGKNWPVTDGKDQIRLMQNSSTAAASAASDLPTSPRGRSENQSMASSRNVSPSKKHIKDPYASLNLFSPKGGDENQSILGPNAVAPRASARPPPREMSELFAAGHEDNEPGSPKKGPVDTVMAPKGGGSQKFAPSRLFTDDDGTPAAVGYKSHPAKYNHFDLGDGIEDDPMQHHENTPKPKTVVPTRPKVSKPLSQWDFSDFATPAKVVQKIRGQDVVHFSLDDPSIDAETPAANNNAPKPRRDNETHFELQDDGLPVERHVVPKPRKDADVHFQMKDTDTPVASRTSGRPTSSSSSRPSSSRLGLYTNNVIEDDEEDEATAEAHEKVPLSTITNNLNRKNDFNSHWAMEDVPPAHEKTNNENNHAGGHRKKPSQMDTHWDNNAPSPDPVMAASTQSRLRKGLESHWNHGEEAQATTNSGRKAAKNFWDF